MIVVDSSAIIAILRMETEAEIFMQALAAADGLEMSAVSAIEVALIP